MRMSVNQTLDRFRKSETLFWIITSAKQWTYSFFWLELTNRVLTTLATEGWFQYFHILVQVLFHCEKETNKSLKTRFFTLFQMRNWWTIWTETKQVCVCVCLCVFVLLYVLCCVFVCMCLIKEKVSDTTENISLTQTRSSNKEITSATKSLFNSWLSLPV